MSAQTENAVDIRLKVQLAFNKYFYDMLEDLQAIDDTHDTKLKDLIAEKYKVRQVKTTKNMDMFRASMTDAILEDILTDVSNLKEKFEKSTVADLMLLKDMSVKDVVALISEVHYVKIMMYVFMLVLLLSIHDFNDTTQSEEENKNVISDLFEKVMNALMSIDLREDDEAFEKSVKDIYDVKTKKILNALRTFKQDFNNRTEKESASDHSETDTGTGTGTGNDGNDSNESGNGDNMDDFMSGMHEKLKGTKIGKFTEEIVDDLTKELKGDIGEITDFSSFMKSGKLGTVINKTVEHFQKKNNSGELNQNDILSECVNLMGIFGNPSGGMGSSSSAGPSASSQTSGAERSGTSGTNGTSGGGMPFNMEDMQKVMSLFSSEDKFKLDPTKLKNFEKSSAQKDRMRKKLEQNRLKKSE